MILLKEHSKIIDRYLKIISYKYRTKNTLLDLGCYDGKRTILFKKKDRRLWGVDMHFNLLKKYQSDITFYKLDFIKQTLPFKPKSFNLIFSFDVIEHLKKPEIMLQKIYRLLTQDGILILSTPNKNRFFNYFLLLFKIKKFPYYFDQAKKNDPAWIHETEYSEKELIGLLENNHFKIIKIHRLFYGFPGGKGLDLLFSLPMYHNLIIECQKNYEKET